MRCHIPIPEVFLTLHAKPAAHIPFQFSGAVFIGGKIELLTSAGQYILHRIQQCGFSGSVVSGDQYIILDFQLTEGKHVPVNQKNLRQTFHVLPPPRSKHGCGC